MRIRPRAYPHPVLAPFGGDVPDDDLQATVAVEPTRTHYKLAATMALSNEDLKVLIAERRAAYAVHVECPTTRYRQLFVSDAATFTREIEAVNLDDRVDICGFVLATVDIAAYTNRGVHDDYRGLSFAISKGDTLAVAPDQTFYADKQDSLKKFASIFSFTVKDGDDASPLEINFEDPHKIVIVLSKGNSEAYAIAKQNKDLHPVLNSMLIVPVLAEAVLYIRRRVREGSLDELQDRRWFRVLSARLKDVSGADDFGDEDEAALPLAILLAGDPVTKGLLALEQRQAGDDED